MKRARRRSQAEGRDEGDIIRETRRDLHESAIFSP